jgi:hypothetical protein
MMHMPLAFRSSTGKMGKAASSGFVSGILKSVEACSMSVEKDSIFLTDVRLHP